MPGMVAQVLRQLLPHSLFPLLQHSSSCASWQTAKQQKQRMTQWQQICKRHLRYKYAGYMSIKLKDEHKAEVDLGQFVRRQMGQGVYTEADVSSSGMCTEIED